MKEQVLIYSQDVGGAKYIAPSVNYIVNRYQSLVVTHPLSEQTFNEHNISFYPLNRFFKDVPPKEAEIGSFLVEQHISNILCTTSSPYGDLTNSYIIKSAKKWNIPTFGFMDHWKGYDRFYDKEGTLSYLPDFIGCIDGFCKNELIKLYNSTEKVFITGHPYLEGLRPFKSKILEKGKSINILIVSQPGTCEGTFDSIFLKKNRSVNVLAEILSQVLRINTEFKFNICFRPHPKEKFIHELPKGVRKDDEEKRDDVFKENDIFIGLDSTLLIEARLLGKQCIVMRIPEFNNVSDFYIPYQIGETVHCMNELPKAILKCIELMNGNSKNEIFQLTKIIQGSRDLIIKYVDQFVNKKLQVVKP